MVQNNQQPDIETHRPSIEGLAYRMLGAWADAQDIAQETLLKWHALAEPARQAIREPLAWLHTVASRLSLDRLKSAQRRRETYVGPWLPEPLLTTDTTPADEASIDDSITLALLHAMERLTPSERAAFILHDVFDYPYATIADILQKEIPACRQLATRARKSLRAEKTKTRVDPAAHKKLLSAFLQAITEGDESGLKSLLAADAILYTDGGAAAKAARKPIHTPEIISRLFLGLSRKSQKRGDQKTITFATLNKQLAALIFTNDTLDTVFNIEVQNGQIQNIYIQRNPEKLKRLRQQFEG